MQEGWEVGVRYDDTTWTEVTVKLPSQKYEFAVLHYGGQEVEVPDKRPSQEPGFVEGVPFPPLHPCIPP